MTEEIIVVSNKVYDKLGTAVEDYLEEELGVNMSPDKLNGLLQVILNHFGMKKE